MPSRCRWVLAGCSQRRVRFGSLPCPPLTHRRCVPHAQQLRCDAELDNLLPHSSPQPPPVVRHWLHVYLYQPPLAVRLWQAKCLVGTQRHARALYRMQDAAYVFTKSHIHGVCQARRYGRSSAARPP